MCRLRRLALVLCALLLMSPAAAQGGLRSLGDPEVVVRPGQSVELFWDVAAVDGQDHFVLASVTSDATQGWTLELGPSFANIPAGEVRTFTLVATPGGDPLPRQLHVLLTLEDGDGNATLSASGQVQATGFAEVLGRYENPLPPPLDGHVGTFLLNVLAWTAIGLVVMLLVSPTLKVVSLRTKTTLDDTLIAIVAGPVFVLIFAYGMRVSLASLPLPGLALRILDILWIIVATLILVYAAFRLWHEIVLAIGRRAASRTRSTLDDRLIPVLEKLGGIIIVMVGFFYLADGFGWNMAWLAAGGAIGGLVIAFAAQDTLGNFFAGIHILVDRPFKEGDDIILDTGEVCTVRRIGLRSTDLYHVANHELIIVPNTQLATNRIINILQPDNLYKVRVEVGVAYGTDVQKVKQILMDLGRNHPLSLDDEDHMPFVRFNAFGQSSLDFSLTVWVGDVYARYAVASDLREMIEQRFAEEGIEVPFPQRVLWQGREEAERDEPPRARKRLQLHGSLAEASEEQPPGEAT